MEVGSIGLLEASTTNGVCVIILKDAASGIQQMVDALLVADISHVQGSNDVTADSLSLVVLTPVHVGATSHTSGVEHMSRLVLLDLSLNSFSVVGSGIGDMESLALSLEELNELATDPSVLTEQKVHLLINRSERRHGEK